MNERVKTNLRSAIYEMGGIYLLYLAYQMFRNKEESAGGEYLAVIAAIIGFLVSKNIAARAMSEMPPKKAAPAEQARLTESPFTFSALQSTYSPCHRQS